MGVNEKVWRFTRCDSRSLQNQSFNFLGISQLEKNDGFHESIIPNHGLGQWETTGVFESTYYVWQTLLIPGILLRGGFDSLCLAYERNEGAVVR